MSDIQKSPSGNPPSRKKSGSLINVTGPLVAGHAAALTKVELPRMFNQLVLFLLDGSGSMRGPGISGMSKGQEVHQSVVQVIERLQRSRNATSFDLGFIAYANETKEMFSIRRPKEFNLVKDCYNPCEHILEYEATLLTEALDLAYEKAAEYINKYQDGTTKVLILILSDGALNDHEEALEARERFKEHDDIHFATIFFQSPYWEELEVDVDAISESFSAFANSKGDHLSTVDPEEIRKHMIKSVTTITGFKDL